MSSLFLVWLGFIVGSRYMSQINFLSIFLCRIVSGLRW